MDCENLTKIKINLTFTLAIFMATTVNLVILIHNIQYVANIDIFYRSESGRFTFTNSSGKYESDYCYYPSTCAELLTEISSRTVSVVVYSVIYNFTQNPLTSIDYYTSNTLYTSVIILVFINVFALIMFCYNRKWKRENYLG